VIIFDSHFFFSSFLYHIPALQCVYFTRWSLPSSPISEAMYKLRSQLIHWTDLCFSYRFNSDAKSQFPARLRALLPLQKHSCVFPTIHTGFAPSQALALLALPRPPENAVSGHFSFILHHVTTLHRLKFPHYYGRIWLPAPLQLILDYSLISPTALRTRMI